MDAAAADARDEHCLLSFWEDTLLAFQASSVTRLNGLLRVLRDSHLEASAAYGEHLAFLC